MKTCLLITFVISTSFLIVAANSQEIKKDNEKNQNDDKAITTNPQFTVDQGKQQGEVKELKKNVDQIQKESQKEAIENNHLHKDIPAKTEELQAKKHEDVILQATPDVDQQKMADAHPVPVIKKTDQKPAQTGVDASAEKNDQNSDLSTEKVDLKQTSTNAIADQNTKDQSDNSQLTSDEINKEKQEKSKQTGPNANAEKVNQNTDKKNAQLNQLQAKTLHQLRRLQLKVNNGVKQDKNNANKTSNVTDTDIKQVVILKKEKNESPNDHKNMALDHSDKQKNQDKVETNTEQKKIINKDQVTEVLTTSASMNIGVIPEPEKSENSDNKEKKSIEKIENPENKEKKTNEKSENKEKKSTDKTEVNNQKGGEDADADAKTESNKNSEENENKQSEQVQQAVSLRGSRRFLNKQNVQYVPLLKRLLGYNDQI